MLKISDDFGAKSPVESCKMSLSVMISMKKLLKISDDFGAKSPVESCKMSLSVMIHNIAKLKNKD